MCQDLCIEAAPIMHFDEELYILWESAMSLKTVAAPKVCATIFIRNTYMWMKQRVFPPTAPGKILCASYVLLLNYIAVTRNKKIIHFVMFSSVFLV